MAMAMDSVCGTAENVITAVIIVPVMELIDDVIRLGDTRPLLREQLNRMKRLLQYISYHFDNEQKSPPDWLLNCVLKMRCEVRKARQLIETSQRPHHCIGIDCAFLFEPRLSRQIRSWTATFNGLFHKLRTDFVSGTVGNAINTVIIVPVMELIDDVIHLDGTHGLLQEQLNRTKVRLQDISYQFDNQQKSPSKSFIYCLTKMEGEVKKARALTESSQRPQRCIGIDCAFPFKPILSRQIIKWTTTFNGLFDELEPYFVHGTVVAPLIQQIDDVMHLADNRGLLEEQLSRMKDLLRDICYQFDNQHKTPPDSLTNCVEKMRDEVRKARALIDSSQRPHQCLGIDCAFLFNLRLSTQIRKWKTTFDGLFVRLRTDFSVLCSAQQIASFTPRQAEKQIEKLLTEAPHVRRIGVYGTAGVGRTTLLTKIYNTHKEVSDFFEAFIWITVPLKFSTPELQGLIASQLNLELPDTTDVDVRKMKLSAHLKARNFFMVLEDMWTTLDLEQLGVEFNNERVNKLIFSTRNSDLIEEMKADECMKIEAMSTDEGWDLFSKVAFKEAAADLNISEGVLYIARQVCGECKGLPLLINVIASSMIGKNDVNEWKLALRQLQKRDFVSPIPHHPRIDRDLFQRMRWSYHCLSDANLKICFLYCAMFPQATAFQVNPLVHMWIAEGVVESKDTGHMYVNLLENRCLFQVQHQENVNVIAVNDAVRDMAIYIGEREEKCVFRAGQMLQQFPDTEIDYKRISVMGNNIHSLPAKELRCQNLVTLFLGKLELDEIPEAFLQGLTSLKVLDVGDTPLKALPLSLWELRQLEFLNLSGTEIESVHEGIGNLSSLQFLYISHCSKLKTLPSQIAKIQSLKYLDFSDCDILKLVPKQITKLSNCKIVQ